MQMLNAIAEPNNAITVSKEGTRIASIMMVAIVAIRIRALTNVVVRVGGFNRRPMKDSMVILMGLTLSQEVQLYRTRDHSRCCMLT